jgi:hypothetical protein
VTAEDIERLRALGFTEVEICDIVPCAAFRCFVSRFLMRSVPALIDADADFRKAMTVGRAI